MNSKQSVMTLAFVVSVLMIIAWYSDRAGPPAHPRTAPAEVSRNVPGADRRNDDIASNKNNGIGGQSSQLPMNHEEAAGRALDDQLVAALDYVCDPVFLAQIDAEGKPWRGGDDFDHEDYLALLDESSRPLVASTDPDQLHAAALIATDTQLQLTAITQALEAAPGDPFMLWSAVHLCSKAAPPERCPLDRWIQQLVEVDSQNSEVWATAAVRHYQQGRTAKALDALRQASGAPETREYWIEQVELLRRGFSAGSNMPIEMQAVLAFGRSNENLPSYGYWPMCTDMAATDSEWATVCLRYAQLTERQSISSMTQALARDAQRGVLTALGNSDAVDAVDKREREIWAESSASSDAAQMASDLMILDEAIFAASVAAIRQHGDIRAMQSLAAAIEDIWAAHPELRCSL